MTPAEIDEAMAEMLPPSLASSIKAEWRSRRVGPESAGQWEQYIAGWGFEGEFEGVEAEQALPVLEALNAPAGLEFALKELLRLKSLTKARNQEFDDVRALYAAYGDELQHYPEDVARDACKTSAADSTFFPSWAELRVLCKERVLKRRCLLEALRRLLERQARMAEGAPKAVEDKTHYNVTWRVHRDEIIRAVGEKEWRMWFEDLIPADPALDKALAKRACEATYFLACPSRGWAGHVNRLYAETLRRVLGRPVEAVDRHWASQACERRRARSGG